MSKTADVPRSAPERAVRLAALREAKMAESAHAFVRARDDLFYEVLAQNGKGFPIGPAIWISGDAHAENMGAVPDAGGEVSLMLNDFDESVIGNPAYDLTRLALSLVTAARGLGATGGDAHATTASVVAGYEAALDRAGDDDAKAPKRDDRSPVLQALVRAADETTRRDLLTKLTGDDHPRALPLGDKFWPLSNASRDGLAALATQPAILELTGGAPIEVLDVAFRVAGTASLGGFRAALLVSVEGAPKGERLRLLDVKEAASSAAPALEGTPTDDAERSLQGARALAPRYGARKRAVSVQTHRCLVRELMPQEKKVEIDRLARDELASVAFGLGRVVGKAHARQLSARDAKSWRADVTAKREDDRPPRWLSRALAALVGAHEAAYLAHCAKVDR
jgi:uncharacterized protein (DUF2252 family)